MRRALAAATLGLLAAAVPATAAWEQPARASQGPLPAHSPTVAMNARGDAVAAWVRGARRAQMIVVSVRAAGQTWSDPVAVSRRRRPAIDPVATIDAQGGIVVVWRQVVRVRRVPTADGPRRQAVYVVRARQRALGSPRWSRVTTLSSPREKVGAPSAASDASGDVIATWHWGTGTSPADPGFVGQVQYAERPVGSGWTGPKRISRSAGCSEVRRPKVAEGALGDAVIWWQCDLPAGRSTAMAVARPAGRPLGPEAQLPIMQRGDLNADLAVAPTGRATAVSAGADGTVQWWRGDVGDTLTLSALAALTTTERIDVGAGPPRVAVSTAGDALTAWTDLLGRPRAAPVATDLGVGAPVSLGEAARDPGPMAVAVGDGRQGVVAWYADGRVVAAQRAATGGFAPAAPISGSGVVPEDGPAVAGDGIGNAVAFWTRGPAGRTVVERAATATP
ncbi:MAG: hypothetical protein AB7O78_09560 [Thermoleophilia bacterium]